MGISSVSFAIPHRTDLTLPPSASEQPLEFRDREARVANDTAEGGGVDGIVAWNGEDPAAVGHDYVLSLASDSNPAFSSARITF